MTNQPERDAIAAELERIGAERRRLLAELAELAPKAERTNRLRLTKSSVRALPIPSGDKHSVYWDRDLVGFGVRVSPHGGRTYFLQVRTKSGRGIKLTLGRANRVTAEQARDAARKHLAAVDLGRDPAAELKAARLAERERRKAPDMRALWADLQRHPVRRKGDKPLRPKSLRCYEAWWRRHLEPRIGRAKPADLTAARIRALHQEITAAAGAVTANRALATLSRLMARAVELGLIAANPCQGVARHQEEGRERTLTDAELAKLITYLDGHQEIEARAIELLICTGCRRGELLSARWCDLDLTGGWWSKPASTTKSGRPHKAPLNQAALAILGKLPRRGELVLGGLSENRLSHWWQRERAKLGLPDVRAHDLRHCAASLAVASGAPLYTVAKLLGHAGAGGAITARYSHVQDTELARASQAISDRFQLLKAPVAGRG